MSPALFVVGLTGSGEGEDAPGGLGEFSLYPRDRENNICRTYWMRCFSELNEDEGLCSGKNRIFDAVCPRKYRESDHDRKTRL